MNINEELIKESIEKDFFKSCEDIVFLLGAGASVDAGISTISELTVKFENKIQINNEAFQLYKFFKNRSLYANILNGNKDTNIEAILALINDHLYITPQHPLYHLIGNWDKELLSITAGKIKPIEDLKNEMETFLALELKNDNGNLSYLHSIFELQSHLDGILKLFSLNHDLIIEKSYFEYYLQYCQDSPETGTKHHYLLETGFDDTNYNIEPGIRFDINRFDLKRQQKKIHLYKLHGSINWTLSEKKEIISGQSPNEFVFGVSQKYKSGFPYSELYSKFKQALANAKILVIIGYSFQDQHINDAIKNALISDSNSALKIIINNCSLCETEFFSFPKISTKKQSSESYLLNKIFKHVDYEHYMNFALMMHPVYYSRNYDEDAIFLAKCFLNKDLLNRTNASAHHLELFHELIREVIFGFNNLEIITLFKKYYSEETSKLNNEEKGVSIADIYNSLLNNEFCAENFNKVKQHIAETKIALYILQNKVAQILGRESINLEVGASEYSNSSTNRIVQYIHDNYEKLNSVYSIVKEIIDEVRLIEKYILQFIPTHLAIMIGMIEQFGEAKNDEQNNFSVKIYEWFLKYNYLIEMLIIQPIDNIPNPDDKNHSKILEYNILVEQLGKSYVDEFNILVDDLEIRDSLMGINNFLKEIRNAFLFRNKSKRRIDSLKINLMNFKFEKIFLSIPDKSNKIKRHLPTDSFMRSVLHPKTKEEIKMQTRVRIYSKAIAKSMSSRLNYLERLTTDIITIAKQMENHREIVSDIYRRNIDLENHFETVNLGKVNFKFYSQTIGPILDSEFFEGYTDEQKKIEKNITANMNWFARRYSKIMKEFLSNLAVIEFHDPGRGYINNLDVYQKLFEPIPGKNMTAYIRDYRLAETIEEKNVYLSKCLNCINPLDLQRIIFKHFRAQDFLTKELRSWHLFKYYHSHFYAEEHIFTFGNIDRILKSKLKFTEILN